MELSSECWCGVLLRSCGFWRLKLKGARNIEQGHRMGGVSCTATACRRACADCSASGPLMGMRCLVSAPQMQCRPHG